MPEAGGDADSLRLDKWLWHARFWKTRSRATKAVAEHGVRINGEKTIKPGRVVKPGDVLTFALGPHIRVIRIEALGERRGPAPEAIALYVDLDPPSPSAPKEPPAGRRPTKRDRRQLDRLRDTGQ